MIEKGDTNRASFFCADKTICAFKTVCNLVAAKRSPAALYTIRQAFSPTDNILARLTFGLAGDSGLHPQNKQPAYPIVMILVILFNGHIVKCKIKTN